MAIDEWFRNTTWNEDIALQFEAKLRRARRKEQHLRIQACMLTSSHPQIALALLDRYFEMPDDFDHAQAHVDRATAHLSEGHIEQAIASYEAALHRETQFPRLLTQAYIDLPYLIAMHNLENYYERAIEILETSQERLMFAVDHFKWNATQAFIAHARNNTSSAKIYAKAALSAADRDSSGFRYHPRVGLVQSSYEDVQSSLRTMCVA